MDVPKIFVAKLDKLNEMLIKPSVSIPVTYFKLILYHKKMPNYNVKYFTEVL